MTTSTNPQPDNHKLQSLLKHTMAQLMAHGQKLQETMKENMELRAALCLAQTEKNGLDAHINSQLEPVVSEKPNADTVPV